MYFWPAFALCMIIATGVNQTILERRYPTPHEWTFLSRWFKRSARALEEGEGPAKIVDWRKVGDVYRQLIGRLENEKIDGANLIPGGGIGEGGILVEGVGHTGFNVSMKSEPWRRGYYEALMGAARVAENLDGHVLDRSRRRTYPKEVVVGLSNSQPQPMPFGVGDPPREEDCEAAFEGPQVWYLRILTTEGFNASQKMEAALAYADWLDFEGLRDTAQNMFEWALDIATSGLDVDDTRHVVDKKTGVINPCGVEQASANILKACTAMGVHHAARGDVRLALPIFLSVLRARKDLPTDPVANVSSGSKGKMEAKTGLETVFLALRDWLAEAPYPPPPPDGNQRPFRSLKEACEEIGLMMYIGEILYATSSVMWVMEESHREEGKERCQECLRTGLSNWKKMSRNMAIQAEKQEQEAASKKSWFKTGSEKFARETRKWEEEEAQIELRIQKTAPLIDPIKPPTSWLAPLI